MGPPGGGRNPVTSRFLRHFNIIGITPFNDETMQRIFSTIVSYYLRVSAEENKNKKQFLKEIKIEFKFKIMKWHSAEDVWNIYFANLDRDHNLQWIKKL